MNNAYDILKEIPLPPTEAMEVLFAMPAQCAEHNEKKIANNVAELLLTNSPLHRIR